MCMGTVQSEYVVCRCCRVFEFLQDCIVSVVSSPGPCLDGIGGGPKLVLQVSVKITENISRQETNRSNGITGI